MIEVVRERAPRHPLAKNGACVGLVALRDGRPVFSMLTGVDRRYVHLTGEERGWFSRFEGFDDPEAAAALIREAAAFQRSQGMEALWGPAPPDGRFQPGLLAEGCPDRLLRENGFRVSRESVAFRVCAPALPGMKSAAARARAVHGVRVRRAGFSKACCRAVYGLYEPRRLPFDEFAGLLDDMRPLEFFVVSARGEDAGFALVRDHRVETVMIAPRFQRGPALLCLLDALADCLGPEVLTGAIDRENTPSLAVARALGGRECELWREYLLYLI